MAKAPARSEVEPWVMAKTDGVVVARGAAASLEAVVATMVMAVALTVAAAVVTVEANGALVDMAVVSRGEATSAVVAGVTVTAGVSMEVMEVPRAGELAVRR